MNRQFLLQMGAIYRGLRRAVCVHTVLYSCDQYPHPFSDLEYRGTTGYTRIHVPVTEPITIAEVQTVCSISGYRVPEHCHSCKANIYAQAVLALIPFPCFARKLLANVWMQNNTLISYFGDSVCGIASLCTVGRQAYLL